MEKQNPLDATIWQCDCGKVEYGEYPPDECNKCWDLNSFIQITKEDLGDDDYNILEGMRNSGKSNEDE